MIEQSNVYVVAIARRESIAAEAVWVVIACNAVWTIGSIALLLSGLVAPSCRTLGGSQQHR
jgi:hypothetical protein